MMSTPPAACRRAKAIADDVVTRAVFLGFRRTFALNCVLAVIAAAVAAAGVALLAWGANPPAAEEARRLPAIILEPVVVAVDFTDSGKTKFADQLGSSCS